MKAKDYLIIGITAISLILLLIVLSPIVLIDEYLLSRMRVKHVKKLLFILLIFIGCEKEPVSDVKCYDCLIRQPNGIEYPAVYCVAPDQYQDIMNNQGYVITCKERKQ